MASQEYGPHGDAKTSLITRNVKVGGKRTSVRLEPELWDAFELVCRAEGKTVNDACTSLADQHAQGSFTSSIRVYIVQGLQRGKY